jgi:hypothetical protein
MNQFGFDLPLKKASYKWWTIQAWKEKAEQYKFGEHFVKSLVDLLHKTEEGRQWIKKVLKEQNRAFKVNPPPKLVMSKIQGWIKDPASQGDGAFTPITAEVDRYTCLTMSSLDKLRQ